MIYEIDFGIYKNFETVTNNLDRIAELGTTHIELMPILEHNKETAWGYETVDFLSIHSEYGTKDDLRKLILRANELSMQVIVDMCLNHCGDTSRFNKNWFVLYKGNHTNYTGCGNTFNAHNPIFIEYAMQSLHSLVDLGIGGFRFDLAPLLMINGKGEYVYHMSLLERMDTEFSGLFRAYEPWSLDGYFKSKFDTTGYEWNDLLRDCVRNYILGRVNLKQVVNEMNAYHGNINFVTCHDGFSLWDVFSYNKKNNWSNGEDNRDGNSNEVCGVVAIGTKLSCVEKALKIIILANGIPMLRSYDEFLSTFGGNNNNYKKSDYTIIGNVSNYIKELNESKKKIDYDYKIEIVGENKIRFMCKDGNELIVEI
ncbi:MAG: alpha-amylase family glycosyl hydrolase [Cetobacterium sp.]